MLYVLIGLVLAVALLAWFGAWLQGSQGARLFAFVLFAPVVGFWAATVVLPPGSAILREPAGCLAFLVGTLLAWPLASLPTYLRGRTRVRPGDRGPY